MIRLVPAFVLGFLGMMWVILDAFTPLPRSERLKGGRTAQAEKDGPALAPATAVTGRTIRSPLAMLILDVSGSMRADKDFKERVAADIFAFFFTRLSARDVPPSEMSRVHLALGTFPDQANRCRIEEWEGKPWLAVSKDSSRYETEAMQSLDLVGKRLDALVGRPGRPNPRNGGDTPHDEAVKSADQLIASYREAFGADADIFAVYFTDEPISQVYKDSAQASGLWHLGLRPAGQFANGAGTAFEVVGNDPKLELTYFNWQNEEPHTMVDRFLRGLRLEPANGTKEFGSGFPSDKINQLLPVVIRGKRWSLAGAPRLETNSGTNLPIRNMGDTYYTVLDPADPIIRNATSIILKGGTNAEVTVYRRPQWSLLVEPGVVGLLELAEQADVKVSYSGANPPGQTGIEDAVIRSQRGDFERAIALLPDSNGSDFSGQIRDLRSFPGQGEYSVIWISPEGTELRYPFKLRREFDIRFVDSVSKKTGRDIRGVQTLPQR